MALVGTVLALAPGAATAQLYYTPLPDEYYRGPRLRLLTEGEVGGTFGQEGGLGGGATVGVGLQVNDIIAGYVQHRFFAGDSLDGVDAGAFGHSYNSFMLDLTVFDHGQLGIGPSVDFGVGALCPIDANAPAAARCDGVTGPYVGLDVRVAVMLYERNHARRRGVAIVAHVHPTWIDRGHSILTVTLGAGFTLY